MAHTNTSNIGKWDNFHSNGPFPVKTLFDTSNDGLIFPLLDRYNDAAKEIQRLIQDSADNNERLRAFGSAWSLSNIAHQKDRMFFNARLNIKFAVTDNQVHPASEFTSENLFFIQCGTTIKEITEYLFKKGKSLKTCGASNGQTIAGAISTGVHGSALNVGAIQDYVVGLNIIIGPGKDDIVYIERASLPALTDDFAKSINARVIRNDELFYSAVVGLGAFGVIHGVVLEAENRYLLKRYVKKINRVNALELAEKMNFADAAFNIPTELDEHGKGTRPYHYKLYINPYKDSEDFVTEIIYKKPFRTDYDDPVPRIKKAIYKDIPTWIALFAAKFNRLIPAIIGALKSEAFPTIDDDIEGTLGEIFWDTTQQSAAFGSALGLDIADAGKALDIVKKVMNEKGPVPGILSMRFVKGSNALLGFTKFPITCILEVDGVLWQGNQNMISLDDYLTEVTKALVANNIKFTYHWGKHASWGFPGLVDYMYGNNDDVWKDNRSMLLTKQMADLFSNDFLDTLKLSDYRANVTNRFDPV